MKSNTFTEKILSLPDIEFERFVALILLDSNSFSNIGIYSTASNFGFDICATYTDPMTAQKEDWLFELKRTKLAGVDLIEKIAYYQSTLKKEKLNSQIVLVIAGHLEKTASIAAHELGIKVWDSSKLESLVTKDILENIFGSGAILPDITNSPNQKANDLIQQLKNIQPGKTSWSAYQKICAEILEFVFCPPLEPPRYEFPDQDNRNRRDLIFENSAQDEFWSQIRNIYSAHYIVVDAKNCTDSLNKKPVVDIAHYLKPYGCGLFAMLLSRKGAGDSARHAIKEQWIGSQKMIIALSDSDIDELLIIKGKEGQPEEVIRRIIANFRMSL